MSEEIKKQDELQETELTAQDLEQPAGGVELTEKDLEQAAGGVSKSIDLETRKVIETLKS